MPADNMQRARNADVKRWTMRDCQNERAFKGKYRGLAGSTATVGGLLPGAGRSRRENLSERAQSDFFDGQPRDGKVL